MKFVAVAATLALPVLLWSGGPRPAQAQPVPPVTINSCAPIVNTQTQPTPAPLFGGLQLASTSSGIAIEFVNDSTKTANLVNFAVDSNGQQFVIRDVGTFSPGISIKHTYRNGSGQAFVLPQFIAPRVNCHVASVRFVDGSSWRPGQPAANPPPAPPAAAQGSTALSAAPAALVLDSVSESELFLVSSSTRVAAFKESDNCAGIATVFVAATGESSATYSVKPIAAGSCTAHITDEAGQTLAYPITVR
ncbi:MAG: hypothetical protein ABSB70_15205 [Candidatus Velthaea sp.]|jgi:hypothetical protein